MTVDTARSYTNPVYAGYLADPFVLRTTAGGAPGYVALGTGSIVDGRAFEVVVSPDLVHWERVGGALEVTDPSLGTDYWAPEVAERDGRWWMYYSVGFGDRDHQMRVAVADSPVGPYRDRGLRLAAGERFAIDPHPFRDVDGTWYLYYARDVLEGDRVGTMLAVDVLDAPDRLRGEPRTVLRPSGDWQLFQRGRSMYGAVHDWHTLEGPFVLRRAGRYHLLYSGGSWEGPGYGVAVASADSPLGPWTEPADAPRLLASVPGHVVGPGHCSVVEGPTGGDVLVYHAWDVDLTARRMCIDPLEWTAQGPVLHGPTWQPATLPD
jgi:beta-xylosidase